MMIKRLLIAGALTLGVIACSSPNTETRPNAQSDAAKQETDAAWAYAERLQDVLSNQDAKTLTRYKYRHPAETLEFFGVEPGMTVVDMLPGNVWYAGILAEYLGENGKVIGADYPSALFAAFGASEERQAKRAEWLESWPAKMSETAEAGYAPITAFRTGDLDESQKGTADRVLYIRGMHGAHNVTVKTGEPYLDTILGDFHTILKEGGKLGVVQHRAPETASDEWAQGSNGYLKQSRVIEVVEAAGFELVETSEINANPADQPTEADKVWRLPPALRVDTDEEKVANKAIGESDRMTLLFVKKG